MTAVGVVCSSELMAGAATVEIVPKEDLSTHNWVAITSQSNTFSSGCYTSDIAMVYISSHSIRYDFSSGSVAVTAPEVSSTNWLYVVGYVRAVSIGSRDIHVQNSTTSGGTPHSEC